VRQSEWIGKGEIQMARGRRCRRRNSLERRARSVHCRGDRRARRCARREDRAHDPERFRHGRPAQGGGGVCRRPARAGARPEIEFMRLSSYGLAKESGGAVQLVGDIPAGRPVLLVDDIVDYQPIDRLRLCPIAPPRGRRSLDLRAARQAPAAGGRGRAPFCRLLGRRPVRGGVTAPTSPRGIAICPLSASSSEWRTEHYRSRSS